MKSRKKFLNIKDIFVILSVVFTFSFFGLTNIVSAATLTISPQSGTYTVGASISVSVLVSSADKNTNAASGVISFPTDLLSVSSVSKNGSIVDFWAKDPSFSNANGTVTFEGVLLPPGFTGSSGKLLIITFKAKSSGTANIIFNSGSVLAADGAGTDILSSFGSASFKIAVTSVPTDVTPSVSAGVLLAPKISSPTHSDSNKWYSEKTAKFNWTVPVDVTSVRLSVGKIPTATPTVVYTPATSEKEITDLEDGVWYFNAQFRNSKGWGEISHFRFQIDTQPPKPMVIKFINGNQSIDPSPVITFATTDSLSGIDYYQIKTGNKSFFNVNPNLIPPGGYKLPIQDLGTSTIVINAYDKAGNITTATEEFYISSLASPTVTKYNYKIEEGGSLIIGGTTYPNSDVTIFVFQGDNKMLEQKVNSNSSGSFNFTWISTLTSGAYTLQTQVTDGGGAKSLLSDKITFTVSGGSITKTGTLTVNFFAVMIPLSISLILLLVYLLYYIWHRYFIVDKKLRKEVREAENAIHKAFDLLKESVQEQVKVLEKVKSKRRLTEEETKINKQLKKDLEDAESYIKKEMEDIDKLINK